jgi:UDP-N-acetylmuramate: L-alanyl-gamma-D-glutamyl-meso-diaminopimelate ligase
LNLKKIHLIGIGGTAMATLAALLKHKGHDVRGSDLNIYPPMSTFLAEERIETVAGYRAEHITADLDLVVIGNALSRGNPEVEEVLDRKIRHCSLPEAVREHFLWGARSIVIAGTHGKTTTTSMTAWLLTAAGRDPSMLVGGIAANFGEDGSSYRVGQGRDFVIEGDEYDSAFFDKTAKFLKYLPDIAVIGNIEFDHADIYADLDEIRLAFCRFVNLVPGRGLLVLGTDSPEAAAMRAHARSPVETFGLNDEADWHGYDLRVTSTATSFGVRHVGKSLGRFEVPLLGAHNVRNALAAIAVAHAAGVDTQGMIEGLSRFRGVKRRLEALGTVDGVTVYDDFAHHPTAIAETLAALRAAHPEGRVRAVFEPRSASSCRKIFQRAFADSFRAADDVMIAAVYRSNLPHNERLSAEELVADIQASGTPARYVPTVHEIVDLLVRERQKGDQVVLMSNGGFGGIHGKLLDALHLALANANGHGTSCS